MSTLRVDNVTDLGDDPVVTAGVVDSAAITSVPASALPAGSILQVVSTTKTDSFSASVGATPAVVAVTGLSATITPSSTSSKILVMVTSAINSTNSNFFKAVLYKDGSPSGFIGDTASNRHRTSIGINGGVSASSETNVSLTFLDSPNTTSAITYDLRVGTTSFSDTVYVNRSQTDTDVNSFSRSASSITLMEVAG